MEQALLREVGQGQEGASVKEEGVEVEWEERALEPGPAGIVSAPIVGRKFLTRPASLAITLAALSVGQRW